MSNVKEHQYPEAFKLMRYKCADCAHQETVWNSRNGVTPFGFSCPSCGGISLCHVNYNLDIYAPNYKPHVGQGVFRDGTIDEAIAIAQKSYESSQSRDKPMTKETLNNWVKEIRAGKDDSFKEGWPILTRHGFTKTLDHVEVAVSTNSF